MRLIGFAMLVLTALQNSGVSGNAQGLARRASVRAALANKMDPNFWPTRGRRSGSPTFKQLPATLPLHQISSEEGNYWADRRRSTSELGVPLPPASRQTEVSGPFWANRGRAVPNFGILLGGSNEVRDNKIQALEDSPFWANRGRATSSGGETFWANQERPTYFEQEPLKVNKERLSSDYGPFWANRGRSSGIEDPWKTKERQTSSEENYQSNRKSSSASDSEGPFWANRGRSTDKTRLQRDILYAEEPKYVYLPRYDGRRIGSEADTFWVTRGKRNLVAEEGTLKKIANYPYFRKIDPNGHLWSFLPTNMTLQGPRQGHKLI